MAQSFTHRAPLSSPIEEAWESLQQAETWGSIGGMEDVWDVLHGDDGTLDGFRFAATVAGTRYPGTARATVSEQPRRMVMQIDTSELAGSIEVMLDVEPAITVTLDVRPKGFFSRMMFPVIAGAISTGLPANVDDFARR